MREYHVKLSPARIYWTPICSQSSASTTTPLSLDFAPWVSLVPRSYSFALTDQGVTDVSWSTTVLETLVYRFLAGTNEYLVDQYADSFLQVLEHNPILEAVFMGSPPYTNEDLKKLAGAGSCFFDTLYYQVAAMYRLQTTKHQHLPAPNDRLGTLYDLIVARAPDMSEIGSQKQNLLDRHWNNKGNSMEALAFLLVERATMIWFSPNAGWCSSSATKKSLIPG